MKHAQVEERILGGTTTRRGDIVITRGEGCWVFDDAGNKYLDLGSAQGVAMLGHCHPGVTAAIQAQAETLTLCPSYLYNDKRAEFAKALVDVLPKYLPHVFLANSPLQLHEMTKTYRAGLSAWAVFRGERVEKEGHFPVERFELAVK